MKGHYLALVDGENRIKAGLPVFVVNSWLTGTRLVSVPFATLSDPLISSKEEFEILFSEVLRLSDHLKIPRTHIKTLHASKFIEEPRMAIDRFYVSHYFSLNGTPHKLLERFHLTAVRQPIQKLRTTGLKFQTGLDEEDLKAFYLLYDKTRRRLGLPTQPYRFFTALWDTFMPVGRLSLCLAKLEGRLLAGHIYFKFNGRYSMEFEGWDRDFRHLTPNHFLIWEAIKIACLEGYKVFDFGRTSPNEHGLMKFKERWGTKVIELPEYFHPGEKAIDYNKKERSTSYEIIRQFCRYAPEAIRNPFNEFCYRHLG